MLEVIAKDEVNNASTTLFIPDATTYTAQAMSTLGFSYQTTGYWKHGFGLKLAYGQYLLWQKQLTKKWWENCWSKRKVPDYLLSN